MMAVANVTKDPDRLMLVLTAEFDAPVDRVWQVWEDPRELERWWGPPSYPATVVDHDLRVDGRITYFMTGPEGDVHHGWWRVLQVRPPSLLEFEDGFADADGTVNRALPTTVTRVTLEAAPPTATKMVLVTTFASLEVMEQVLEMGAEEGLRQAVGQIDAVLTNGAMP